MPKEQTTTPEPDVFTDAIIGDVGTDAEIDALVAEREGKAKDAEEQSATDDSEKDQQPDTETETEAKDAPDTETETVDDQQGLMQELNLGGEFKSSDDALRSIPHKNKELGERDHEIDVLKSLLDKVTTQLSQPKAPALDESLTEEEKEQAAWFDKMAKSRGFVRKEELEAVGASVKSMQHKQAFDTVVGAIRGYPELKDVADHYATHGDNPRTGLNKRWDAMQTQYDKYPSLKALPADEMIGMLYEMTGAGGSKATVPKVPPGNKKSADTTGTARVSKTLGIPADILSGPADKIFAWMEKEGRVG